MDTHNASRKITRIKIQFFFAYYILFYDCEDKIFILMVVFWCLSNLVFPTTKIENPCLFSNKLLMYGL